MKSSILYLVIMLALSTGLTKGQQSLNNTPQVLEKLYNRLANNSDDSDRLRINDSIRSIIDSYAESDTVFKHKFWNIKHLGQIVSPDNLIKIITWNLVLGNNQGWYFCYFIRKKGRGKEKLVYRLSAAYKEKTVRTDTIYSQKNWYGALYYDIKPYLVYGKKCWVILGIDYGNPLISRKIIDVLSFTPDDSVIFGRKWFGTNADTRYREVFQYSSNGVMSLRFNSDKEIIFDHLVPLSSERKDDHQYYGSDYTYDAYLFKDGFWKLTLNVDARNK